MKNSLVIKSLFNWARQTSDVIFWGSLEFATAYNKWLFLFFSCMRKKKIKFGHRLLFVLFSGKKKKRNLPERVFFFFFSNPIVFRTNNQPGNPLQKKEYIFNPSASKHHLFLPKQKKEASHVLVHKQMGLFSLDEKHILSTGCARIERNIWDTDCDNMPSQRRGGK